MMGIAPFSVRAIVCQLAMGFGVGTGFCEGKGFGEAVDLGAAADCVGVNFVLFHICHLQTTLFSVTVAER